MKNGKIIVINHYGDTPGMPGNSRHYELACHFAQKGEYDLEFWLCGYSHLTGKYIEELKGLHIQHKQIENGIKVVKIKSIPDRGGLVMRQLNIMVFDFITGLKLIFSRNVKGVILSMPPITFFATDAMKIRRIKMVADVEDLWPLFMEDMGTNNLIASRYMEHYANKTYNAAVAVEAVSEGMIAYVKGKVKDKSKKFWLSPLGVNLKMAQCDVDKKYIEKYPWKDDFIVIYAGAHGRANDIESVLNTIREFNKYIARLNGKRVAFVFMGSGDNKNKLIGMKEQLGIENTYFEDPVPGDVIPHILKNADVCLTNLKKIESFKLVRPNKIFHYMAAKKPILCGIWGEAQDIVEKAGAGIYVDFTDPVGAAKKMKYFFENADFAELGENGYKYVSEYGDRVKISEDFYNNLIEAIQ